MILHIEEFDDVPQTIPDGCNVMCFPARDRGDEYYRARTDRNIGWITPDDQDIVRRSVVGIAGTGGMGGLLAATLVRLGVGEVRIADTETFDISNLNRQFGALHSNIGESKALETARLVRSISNDCKLVVYPGGINLRTVDSFVNGCEVICDEIEFWAVGSRILLHQRAREQSISLFNCNSVGFASHLFLFRPDSLPIEEFFGFTYDEAQELENRIQEHIATDGEVRRVMDTMLRTLVPRLPEYCEDGSVYKTEAVVRARLLNQQQASIIATNPPFATGFLANHVLLYLLRNSGIQRNVVVPPAPPSHLFIDTALLQARVHKGI